MKKILALYLFSTTALSVGAFAGKGQFSGNENEMPISASIAKKSYDFQKDPITFEDFFQKIDAPEVYGLEDERSSHNQRLTLLKEKIIEYHEHKIQDLSTLKQQLNLTEEISSLALSLKEESTSAFFWSGLQDLEAHAESRKKYLSFLAQREEQVSTSQGRWDLVFKFLEQRIGFPARGSDNVLRGTDQLDWNWGIDAIPIPHLTINMEAFEKWKWQASRDPMIPSFLLWLESQKRTESRDELLLRAWRKNNLPNIQLVYDTLKKDQKHEQYEQKLKKEGKELLKAPSTMEESLRKYDQFQIKKLEINEGIDLSQAEFEYEEPTSWENFLYRLTGSDFSLSNAIHTANPIFQGGAWNSAKHKEMNLINSLLSRWSAAIKLEVLNLPIDLAIGEEDYRLNEEEFYELNEAIKTPHYLPEWVRDKKSPLRIIPEKLPIPKLKGGELIVKDGLLSSADHTSSPANGYGLYIIDPQKKFRAVLGRYRDFDQRNIKLIHTDLVEGCGPVLAAGMIDVRNGKITDLSDESGHYKPRLVHLKQAISLLKDAINTSATIKHFCIASRDQINDTLGTIPEHMKTQTVSDLELFESTWQKREEAISFPSSLDYLQPIPGESYEWNQRSNDSGTYGTRSFRFESLLALTDGKPEEWEPLQKEFATIRTNNVSKIKTEAREIFKKRIVEALKKSKIPSNEKENSHLTFRTTGTNKNAKNKHSSISIKLPNQQMQDAAYELIINHRTTGKGPVVRVHDPIQGYIPLGTLPSSVGFRDTIFNISSWAQAIRNDSPLDSVISTYLSFVGGTSDIHSFKIESNGRTLKEVILGDPTSEKQAGIHVYGPETNEDANEWSKAKEAPRITFRTTGTNKNAKSKHSAISIKLPNQQMQDDAYQLIVNHRTTGKGPLVRVYDPKTKAYTELNTLPSSPSGFCDTSFDLSSWAKSIRHAPFDASEISTYLSFVGGTSDIHSFKIKSREKTLKEVIFGNDASEEQPGIHVYAPETDQNANEWSKAKKDDVQQ